MSKKKKRLDASALSSGGEFDMTPMIDMTFLLIIFFMLVTEMADMAKTKLSLPLAEKAVEDDKVVKGRIVINVDKDGKIIIMNKVKSNQELDNLLKNQAALTQKAGSDFPDQSILVRADAMTEFIAVQNVMGLCMKNKIWKIAFGTEDPSKH